MTGFLFAGYEKKRNDFMQSLENHIFWQDSLINELHSRNDSLRINRIEFEKAVKLLIEQNR